MDKTRRLGKAKQPEIRAFVATPAYDGKVDVDYAVSLADSCMHATMLGIKVKACVMGNGAFIEMARNIFAKQFLDSDCTHLFYIDSDLKWESRAFVGLLQAGRPVACGIYPKRQSPEEYPVHYIEDESNPGIQIFEGGWVGCDKVPTGFLCIERSVIEEMVKHVQVLELKDHGPVPWLFSTEIVENKDGTKTFMGEDFAWSVKYGQIFNKPIYAWPDFDFIHHGYRGNWHKFMLAAVKRAEEEGSLINLVTSEVVHG
jgi:hypothetical protein